MVTHRRTSVNLFCGVGRRAGGSPVSYLLTISYSKHGRESTFCYMDFDDSDIVENLNSSLDVQMKLENEFKQILED